MTPWTAFVLTIALLFLQGLATVYITIISSKSQLHDARYVWWNRLTKRGWKIVLCSMLILFLTIAQSWVGKAKEDYENAEQAVQDSILRETQHIEDSIRTQQTISEINAGVDSATTIIYKNLSEALAKQMLKFDTTKKILIDLKDSIKLVGTEDPVLSVKAKSIYKVAKGQKITISISSANSTAKIISARYGVIITREDGSIMRLGNIVLVEPGMLIPKETPHITLFTDTSLVNIVKVEVGSEGTYQSRNPSSEIHTLKEAYILNLKIPLESGHLNLPFRNRWFERNADLFPQRKTTNP